MTSSVVINCACCGKPVVTKYKSKNRTCSTSCYFKLYRANKKLEKAEAEKQAIIEAFLAEQAEQPA
jgi:hypothetical protein